MKSLILPPAREALSVLVIASLFLLLTGMFVGIRPEHFLMVGLFLLLFFSGSYTRKLAVALLPLCRDFMRLRKACLALQWADRR